jgi:toxic protein SymE
MTPQSNTPVHAPTPEDRAGTVQHGVPAKPRRLKVGYSYPDSRASQPSSPTKPMPYLRLCGLWLKAAGFTIGQNVRVEVSEGRLLIEPVD